MVRAKFGRTPGWRREGLGFELEGRRAQTLLQSAASATAAADGQREKHVVQTSLHNWVAVPAAHMVYLYAHSPVGVNLGAKHMKSITHENVRHESGRGSWYGREKVLTDPPLHDR